jgi:1-acyl-sn-glycerol-3-phosphate acyltransferase
MRIEKIIARILIFLQVGKVRVIGHENLKASEFPCILAANHPHYIDPFILASLINRFPRTMTAEGALRFAYGLGGLVLAPWGAFSANLDPNQGGSAYRAAIRVVTSDQPLILFPEGWSNLDGITRPFKKGVVRIAKVAAKKMEQEFPVIPVFLRYGSYPGAWINKISPAKQYSFLLLGFLRYRRGVTVVIGEPILAKELPADDEEAILFLRKRILNLDPDSIAIQKYEIVKNNLAALWKSNDSR